MGDYLTYLKDDPILEVFACYVEGFRPQDGQQWLKAAAEITDSGRAVLLYRAGRTPAGVKTAVSHTASLAGSYAVTRKLAEAVGVVVADTLEDFEDLIRLFCLLRGKPLEGRRLGVVSNAGFECVASADNIGRFCLPNFAEQTVKRLRRLIQRTQLQSIVELRNPLDITPLMNDESFEEAVRAMMEDDNIDLGVVGYVPMTSALNTVPAGPGHGEDVERHNSIAQRLGRLRAELMKPWIALVYGGPRYDPMVQLLECKRKGVRSSLVHSLIAGRGLG